jgi:hypothetical protein
MTNQRDSGHPISICVIRPNYNMGLLKSSHRDLYLVSRDQIYKWIRPLIRINKGNQKRHRQQRKRKTDSKERETKKKRARATSATRNAGNNVVQISHLCESSYGEAFADGVRRRTLTCSPASQRSSVLTTAEFQQPGSDVLCTLSRQQDVWAESRASGGVWVKAAGKQSVRKKMIGESGAEANDREV